MNRKFLKINKYFYNLKDFLFSQEDPLKMSLITHCL
jgi:hypothetical protein